MKNYILIMAIPLLFFGCSTKCGIGEDEFNILSSSAKESLCFKYQEQEAKLKELREIRIVEELKYKREFLENENNKVKDAYINSFNKIKVEVISGKINIYGKDIEIASTNFEIIESEVKKILIFDRTGNSAELWVSYQGDKLLWNIQPDYEKESLQSYLDKDYYKYNVHDKMMTIIYNNEWFRGNYSLININGKYRGFSIKNMKIFIKNKNNKNFR